MTFACTQPSECHCVLMFFNFIIDQIVHTSETIKHLKRDSTFLKYLFLHTSFLYFGDSDIYVVCRSYTKRSPQHWSLIRLRYTKIYVILSLPETIKQNYAFRAKAFIGKLISGRRVFARNVESVLLFQIVKEPISTPRSNVHACARPQKSAGKTKANCIQKSRNLRKTKNIRKRLEI